MSKKQVAQTIKAMENNVKELPSSGLGSRGHMILGMSFSKPIKKMIIPLVFVVVQSLSYV